MEYDNKPYLSSSADEKLGVTNLKLVDKLLKPFWIREADDSNAQHGSKNYYSYQNEKPI